LVFIHNFKPYLYKIENINLKTGVITMVSKKSTNSQSNPGSWECILAGLKSGGKGLSISGDPKIVKSPYGNSIWFDGIYDGFFLENNPLNGLSCFTIEAIIKPDAAGPEEQRFLHIGEIDGDRLLIETRLTKENQWYLDTFIMSGESKKALIYPKLVHPVGSWYHVALTLDKKGKMINYINGKMEIKGEVEFKPINSGAISIGARQNKVSWFKGAIYKIKISPEVLEPKGFLPY
jgi:Concanavalin A-like lectin/glucanases superfamily